MAGFDEKILKNSEVCQLLNVSDYERRQMIAAGILEVPIQIGAAYPRHTLSQILRAQARLTEKARPAHRPTGGRKIKPLSSKIISALRREQ